MHCGSRVHMTIWTLFHHLASKTSRPQATLVAFAVIGLESLRLIYRIYALVRTVSAAFPLKLWVPRTTWLLTFAQRGICVSKHILVQSDLIINFSVMTSFIAHQFQVITYYVTIYCLFIPSYIVLLLRELDQFASHLTSMAYIACKGLIIYPFILFSSFNGVF